jgi:hypothetical protein
MPPIATTPERESPDSPPPAPNSQTPKLPNSPTPATLLAALIPARNDPTLLAVAAGVHLPDDPASQTLYTKTLSLLALHAAYTSKLPFNPISCCFETASDRARERPMFEGNLCFLIALSHP